MAENVRVLPYAYVALKTSFHNVSRKSVNHVGDNCIQIFHLGRYIVGYTVGNLVLRRRASRAVKRDFRPYNRRYASINENFEYGYPQSNALLWSRLKLEHCRPHIAARQPTKCDIINDVKLFPVYRRIYRHKFLTLSNQTSRYKSKCIRIVAQQHNIPSSIDHAPAARKAKYVDHKKQQQKTITNKKHKCWNLKY